MWLYTIHFSKYYLLPRRNIAKLKPWTSVFQSLIFFFYSFNKQFLDYSRQARYCDLLRAEFDAKRMSKKASGDKVGIFFF